MLWRSRGLSLVIVLILAVGIGSSATLASMVETLLIRFPYATSDRFDVVRGRMPKQNADLFLVSIPELRDLRGLTDVFEDVGALRYSNVALADGEYPEQFGCARITWNAIPMTGNPPLVGRGFRPEEDGPGGSRVAVISYQLWQQHFQGDPRIIGRTMKVDGAAYSIIGVMPPHWELWGAQIWIPLGLDWADTNRSARGLWALAVLRRGVTPEQANARLATLARQIEREHAAAYPEYQGLTLRVWNIKEAVQSGLRPAVLVLVGAVGLLLLISCANVASLLLARSTVRSREISIRMALGAGRVRILRQLLTESLVLVAAGGAAGVLLASAWLPLVVRMVPANWLGSETDGTFQLDAGAIAAAVAVSLLTGILFGLAPAWLASRPKFGEALKAGGQRISGDRSGQRARHWLIISEIALTLIVLAGSALMIESYRRLEGLSLGFRPDHLLSFNISVPPAKYPSGEKIAAFYQQALERVAALPGVEGAAVGTGRPIEDRTPGVTTQDFTIEGRPAQNAGVAPNANYRLVSPAYFDVMEIGLKRGRMFTEADRAGAPRVALINETMARVFWPNADPIGQHIRLGNQYQIRGPRQEAATAAQAVTIVGVVADVHQTILLDAPVRQEMYFPQQQRASETIGLGVMFYVCSVQDPAALTGAVRRAIAQIDPEQPISRVSTMDEIVADALGSKRLAMFLLVFFALVATTLSAVGLYAVMAYSVSQRRQEIGVRLAIGAQPRDIRRLVLGQGTRLAAAEVGAGIVATLASTHLMASLLYDVSPTDPLTIGGVAALLCAVALAASWIPARRATRVDPLVVLRYE